MQRLRDIDRGTVATPQTGMQGNGWCFDVLIGSRRIAGRWLEQKAHDRDAIAAIEGALGSVR